MNCEKERMASLPMNPRHPLLLCRTTAAAATTRMLSSSAPPRGPNPNPSLTVLHPTPNPTSELPSKFPHFSSGSLAHSEGVARSSNPVPAAGFEAVECPLVVVSFYKFADFPDHADLRKPLKELCERLVDSLVLFIFLEKWIF